MAASDILSNYRFRYPTGNYGQGQVKGNRINDR